MSPDQATQALRSPLLSGPAYSFPVNWRIWPLSEAALIRSIAALPGGVRDLARVVAVREHHEPERVREAVQDGDLPLQALVLEQLVDREDRLRQLRVVGDAGHPGLPRQAVLPVGVEARVLLDVREVDDVRDRVLVELLDPALVDHQRQVALVVGEDDDVLVDRLPPRERALDLPEVLGVRVDVLVVVDLDAGLLREGRRASGTASSSRRSRCRAASSRSAASRQLLRGAARVAPAATSAARGREPGNREHRRSEPGSPQEFFSGQHVGHAISSSGRSTTKVASGSNPTVIGSPGLATPEPGSRFCTYTVTRPAGVSTTYWVETPT